MLAKTSTGLHWPKTIAVRGAGVVLLLLVVAIVLLVVTFVQAGTGDGESVRSLMFLLAGVMVALVGIVSWVTPGLVQREQASAALRSERTWVQTVLRSTADGIITIDEQGTVRSANAAVERIFGYRVDEIVGQNLKMLMPSPYQEEHDGYLSRYHRTGEAHILNRKREVEGKRKDGSTFPLAIRVREMAGEAEGFYIGTVQDITERRGLEDQLRQAQKLEAVGRLAGGVAHDFNNLLTVVLGESEMALEDLPDDHPHYGPLQEIHAAGTRAQALTRQLLAFSRKQIVALEIFDLNELVVGVEKMLARLIGEDIELSTRTASDPVVVNADRGQIEQVLMNLAVNARDAMLQGGTLSIETSIVTLDEDYAAARHDVVAGDYALISVSDTGTGMTEEVKAQIFEPFFTTKDREHGTGLGLSVCYGIVKQFGGHIAVHSEPGLGSTMRVYLPRAVAPAGAPSETHAATRPRGSETILLVEDEDAVRRMGVRILRAQGYRVLEAAAAEQALLLVEEAAGHVQLLLSDVVLPKMGGQALAERVTELCPDIKVLFVSGDTDDVVLKNQPLERNVALLQKPFTPSALASKVRAVLDADNAK